MADEAGTAGAERDPGGQFRGAAGHARKKEVRDVGACDQQEKAGSRENEEKPETYFRRIDVANGHQARGQLALEFRNGGADGTVQRSLQLLAAALGALAVAKADQDAVIPILSL